MTFHDSSFSMEIKKLTTPIATTRTGIAAILDAAFSIQVYDNFPLDGAQIPSIVVQNVGGVDSKYSIGEYKTSTVKSLFLDLSFQIDIYAETHANRDIYTDNVIEALWDNRSSLNTTYNINDIRLVLAMDVPPQDLHERNIYRKMLQYRASVRTDSD